MQRDLRAPTVWRVESERACPTHMHACVLICVVRDDQRLFQARAENYPPTRWTSRSSMSVASGLDVQGGGVSLMGEARPCAMMRGGTASMLPKRENLKAVSNGVWIR
eukprot:3013778-Prymnesium_polylepis.2